MIKKVLLALFMTLLAFQVSVCADEHIELRKVTYDNEDLNHVINFDVSQDGLIGIGYYTYRINIYDNEGSFLYGLAFHLNGTYSFEFVDENIILYPSRFDTAFIYDLDGNFLSSFKSNNGNEYERLYNQKSVSNDFGEFTMTRTLLSTKIEKLKDNEKVIVWEKTGLQESIRSNYYYLVLGVILLGGMLFFVLFRSRKERKNK